MIERTFNTWNENEDDEVKSALEMKVSRKKF